MVSGLAALCRPAEVDLVNAASGMDTAMMVLRYIFEASPFATILLVQRCVTLAM